VSTLTNTQHNQQSLGGTTTDSDVMVVFGYQFVETQSHEGTETESALVATNTPHTQSLGLIDSNMNETRVVEVFGLLLGDEATATVLVAQIECVSTAANTNTR
jgi:hypothetical protein